MNFYSREDQIKVRGSRSKSYLFETPDPDLINATGTYHKDEPKQTTPGDPNKVVAEPDPEVAISENLSEVSADDIGFMTLKIKEDNVVVNKNEGSKELKRKKTGEDEAKMKMNLVKHLSEIKEDYKTGVKSRIAKNKIDIIGHMAKEENDYVDFDIINIAEIEESNPKEAFNFEEKRILDSPMDYAVRNTENTYMAREQLSFIIKGDLDSAARLNLTYSQKKKTYEFDLLISLIEKYKLFQETKGTKFTLEPEPYRLLEVESKAFVTECKQLKNPGPMKQIEMKIKSREFLINFIKRLKYEFASKNVETYVQENYSEWKSKLCECVNIWDLFASNGFNIKFPFKYLILKRFFVKRSQAKQGISSGSKDTKDLPEASCLTKLEQCMKDDDAKMLPRGIIRGDGAFKTFMHFLLFFLIVYTCLTMPILYIMNIKLSMLSVLEKVIASLFFLDMIFSFRTAFKDKANNWVYDIDVIGDRYIYSSLIFDALASLPFNLFFASASYSLRMTLRSFRSLVKMMRISQIFPAINIVEKKRGFTSLVKLLKLVFTYLLVGHWLATLLFNSVSVGINYGKLERVCYSSTNIMDKSTLKSDCQWTISMYNASFLLIGQYTSLFDMYKRLNPIIEYVIMILGYLMGQFMVAFVYGGVANIILNLNQAANFFNKKVEMLNEHMSFYGVCTETQNDVRTFYNYLWIRHKDIIYSKYHFDLLTESLREKFEKLNLPTNEVYLGQFYKLNRNNTKMIGQILMNLKKKILYPYEILYEEKSVTNGLFVLLNGEVEFCNLQIKNMSDSQAFVEFSSVIKEIEKYHIDKENKEPNIRELWDREELSVVFPLISCLIKTGRNYQRCYSKDFTDLLFLPIESFDSVVFNFPVEMHVLKHNMMQYIDQKKLFDNEQLFKMITTHSSRSVGSFYEKEYNRHNLWIPIPIPISQRKIAKNYFSSFVNKVKNQYREIVVSGDLNITLNGFTISNIISKQEKDDILENIAAGKEEEKKTKNLDPLEDIKEKTKYIFKLVERVMKNH